MIDLSKKINAANQLQNNSKCSISAQQIKISAIKTHAYVKYMPSNGRDKSVYP